MRIKMIAKILILLMIVFFVLSVARSCYHATTPPPKVTASVPTAIQGQEGGVPAPAMQQQQITATPLKPITDMSTAPAEGKTLIERKKAVIRIWNVGQQPGDALPLVPPIYTGAWITGTESTGYTHEAVAGKKIFEKTTLAQISFYVDAQEAGDYAFLVNGTETIMSHLYVSVRVNDSVIVPMTTVVRSGYARLEKGFYRVDIRLFCEPYEGKKMSFSVSMKAPSSSAATTIPIDEMYAEK